jgi:class 3 adenylate cyclase
MVALVRRIFPEYDLKKRTGFPESVPVPARDAAKQIVEDVVEHGRFVEFVALLVQVHSQGFRGTKLRIAGLKVLMDELEELGYLYNPDQGRFAENSSLRKTRNWGVLREGDEYYLSFLRVDVAGNSRLVREKPAEAVEAAYADLRTRLVEAAEQREGRLWNWEGDGGVCAFYGDEADSRATLASLAFTNAMIMYNALDCPLGEPLQVRTALHAGKIAYRASFDQMKGAVLARLERIESEHTEPGTVTASQTVYESLSPAVAHLLRARSGTKFFSYAPRFEPA